ncbi:MAG: hypothetical protein U1F77_10165 [Kiritimatiellia bacterium]
MPVPVIEVMRKPGSRANLTITSSPGRWMANPSVRVEAARDIGDAAGGGVDVDFVANFVVLAVMAPPLYNKCRPARDGFYGGKIQEY